MRTLLAIFLLAPLTIAQRQPPGPIYFGKGSVYTKPILVLSGNPQIGKTLSSTIQYLDMRPGGSAITHWIGFSVFGRSRSSWAGGKLPYLLLHDCSLQVSPDVVHAVAIRSPTTRPPSGWDQMTKSERLPRIFQYPIPNAPGLVGLRFNHQILVIHRRQNGNCQMCCVATSGCELEILP